VQYCTLQRLIVSVQEPLREFSVREDHRRECSWPSMLPTAVRGVCRSEELHCFGVMAYTDGTEIDRYPGVGLNDAFPTPGEVFEKEVYLQVVPFRGFLIL